MKKPDTETNGGARERTVPCEGDICFAYKRWRSVAKKGEVHEIKLKASIETIIKPPEARMSGAARAVHNKAVAAAKAKAKRDGTKYKAPPIPDEFKLIRADVMALEKLLDIDEVRGLIELTKIGMGKSFQYEAKMLVQRNGLTAVREHQ